jgi:hypothetical protein
MSMAGTNQLVFASETSVQVQNKFNAAGCIAHPHAHIATSGSAF